ncbi:MAG TPA: TRAP transporter large permease [Candidatus Sumerlaeota bacterium]|nr:TRAP transporter large permease [Candidatus Sumerlaeota bacterium]HON49228.1 TRAP transporter large permease [Candidatus Sumerlaeota bacterium]HOR64165.1 TRAP transporter large permease [Candidatus Sumerlaeota bacterium]HPL73178.1 TRAP transporter large permease [Candidatus Sumerlaeota bacterium]HRR32377.1 TRAP transporter large permease [Candidatus Sumerlaeia bacterium]
MTGPTLGLLGIIVLLLAMFALRVPASFIMAIVGFIGIVFASSWKSAMTLLGTDLWATFSGYGFTVIPMFILLGEFIFHAGLSDRLYRAAHIWFGHWRGGVAVSTVMACSGFSAICGSNTATAATMTAVAIPSMKKYKYHPCLMGGAVAAGSTLGVMIPPSIVLVVYGLYTGQSISKLFFGTLIPGLVLTVLMMLTILAICTRHPEWGPKGEQTTWSQKIRALPEVLDILILFAAIMIALLSGVVTATEAAAASSFLGLILCLIRRKLPWKKFKAAVEDTLRISCMVFMIVAGATIFGRFMALTRLPSESAQWIGGLALPSWVVLVLMLVCYAIGGCIMDALAFLLISLPIFFELVKQMGYDPVWFGVVITLITTMGAITPPVAICCFIVSGMSKDISIGQVYKGSMYFLPAYIITLILLMLIPAYMVLMLANLVR